MAIMRNMARAACVAVLGAGLLLGAVRAEAADVAGIVVYETDFGVKDGAVSAMRGVARGVEKTLILEDLTHDIPAFDIWEGAYRLNQTAAYWPPGTVFVIVIDPGVGGERKNLVMRSKSGHYFVAPDNGVLTLVAESLGIDAVNEIDFQKNRLPGSEQSYTFFGRDLFSYTGARLASGKITMDEVGVPLTGDIVRIDYQHAEFADGKVTGNIPVLDIQYGNVWTNIDRPTFEKLGFGTGNLVKVKVFDGDEPVWDGEVPYVNTFSDVPEGDPLLYFNSLDNVSLAINYGDFASTYGVSSGPDWRVELAK